MRLIDADALRESVLKWLPHDSCGVEERERPYETDICVSMLMEIEDAPTVEPEPHWIPCSDRLPDKSGIYLVTRGLNDCGALWNRVFIINYSDLMGIISERIWWRGNVGKSDFERLDDVLAWMPLPEPYREGDC